jgi:HK97 family phage major capsid protein
MLRLPELREARSAVIDTIRRIVDKAENEKRELTDVEQSAFDAGKKDIERLEGDIRNAEFLADQERRMDGEPIGNGDNRFDAECRQFSLLSAIRSQIPGIAGDFGREIEISRELERRAGRPAQGMLCPTSVFEKRVVTTALPAAGPGSNLIGTDWRPDQFIDILRDAMAVRRLGARVLNGLVGNVDIPRLKASATAQWVAENSAITASDAQFDKISLTPKHVGGLVEVSRNMILQSSPDVEAILRDDLAALLARAIDSVAIAGGSTNQPSGILVNAGVTSVTGTTGNGGAITWANVIAAIASVELANAMTGSLGFLTNAKVTKSMATTLKSTADTSSNFIISEPGANSLAGYPMAVSNLCPSNLTRGTGSNLSAMIFGDWSQLLIGYWSSFDLLVNPYSETAYTKGNVLIRGMATCDVQIRQAKAFAYINDIIAA